MAQQPQRRSFMQRAIASIFQDDSQPQELRTPFAAGNQTIPSQGAYGQSHAAYLAGDAQANPSQGIALQLFANKEAQQMQAAAQAEMDAAQQQAMVKYSTAVDPVLIAHASKNLHGTYKNPFSPVEYDPVQGMTANQFNLQEQGSNIFKNNAAAAKDSYSAGLRPDAQGFSERNRLPTDTAPITPFTNYSGSGYAPDQLVAQEKIAADLEAARIGAAASVQEAGIKAEADKAPKTLFTVGMTNMGIPASGSMRSDGPIPQEQIGAFGNDLKSATQRGVNERRARTYERINGLPQGSVTVQGNNVFSADDQLIETLQ